LVENGIKLKESFLNLSVKDESISYTKIKNILKTNEYFIIIELITDV